MTDTPSLSDAAVAAFIQRCTEELQQQAERSGCWPNPLRLPLPQNAAQRHALDLWLGEIKQQTGATIRVEHLPTHYPPYSDDHIEQVFAGLGFGITCEELVWTAETIAHFREAAHGYASHEGIDEGTSEEGFRYIRIDRVQVRNADPRRDVLVVDFGDFRLCSS
jgi:hypothetical protein